MNAPLGNKTMKMKSPFRLLLVVLTLLITLAAVFYGQLDAVYPESDRQVSFTIRNGAAAGEIATHLRQEGLIKNDQVFLIYARLTGNIDKMKAGHYLLKPSLNIPQIMDLIVKGKVVTLSFTIPEGFHLRQIAEVLVKQGITTEDDFWKAVREGSYNYPFLKELPKSERRLEGYLFPDTYIVPVGMDVESVLDVMLKRFDQVYSKLPPNETGMTMHEVVTLASIVEGESMLDAERPSIASVFLNRLNIKMKLDSDATIQYLFDKRKERVLYKDLEIDSPYNTYRNRGLPPGPIGSPGEASLRAVLQPDQTNYLYFVAKKDGSGEHVFARTLEEHNANKRRLGY